MSRRRQQLLILRNDDYASRTAEHMSAVFSFLGLRDPSEADWQKIVKMEVRRLARHFAFAAP